MNKAALHSHTRCQAVQADTQAKTWQRECQPNRMADQKTDEEKEALDGKITYTQGGVSRFVGQVSSKFKVQFFGGRSVVKIPAYL